jgi:hypothetical protein
MRPIPFIAVLGLAAVVVVSPPQAGAQQADRADVPGDGFGFQAALGFTSISQDYGDVITDGIPAEGGVWYQTGAFRGGLNVLVASYDVVDPFGSQSISQVEIAASALLRFRRQHRLQPFVGARIGAIRFRPEGALFDPVPPPPDELPGENPAKERTGLVGGLSAGAEFWFTRHVGLQALVGYRAFSTEAFDIPLLGVTDVKTGGAFDLRLGVEWAI